MPKSRIDIYTDELRFLIDLKQSVGIINTRIHDKLAWIAIEKLRVLHPDITCEYHGAGAGGIDIIGLGKEDGSKKLIAEVKTTHTSATVGLRGPQKNAIERDLERLTKVPGELKRYLIVISEHTKNAIEKQIRPREKFPLVTVIDAIGRVDLPSPTETDDNE